MDTNRLSDLSKKTDKKSYETLANHNHHEQGGSESLQAMLRCVYVSLQLLGKIILFLGERSEKVGVMRSKEKKYRDVQLWKEERSQGEDDWGFLGVRILIS